MTSEKRARPTGRADKKEKKFWETCWIMGGRSEYRVKEWQGKDA